jgi:hypothetical protein
MENLNGCSQWTRQEILEFPGTLGGPWSRYIVDISLREMNHSGTDRRPTPDHFAIGGPRSRDR